MKFTRLISFVLALLLLTGSLAACGNTTDTDTPSDTTAAGVETENENAVKDNLPDNLNYNEETITFISQYVVGLTSGEISVPELNSDPINDSVYERNKFVENRLNIKIKNIEEKTSDDYVVVNKVVTSVKSGTNEYDALTSPCYVVLDQSINGTFANLNSSQYLELDQIWWTQGFNEAVSYKDTQYVAAGSILLSIYRFAFGTVFNKDMFTDANQPFLYDSVRDGTWTLDKQSSLVTTFHVENGDGNADEKDIYGLSTGLNIYVDPYWASCEIDILDKDEDGEYALVFDSSRLYDAAEKVLRLYYETDNSTIVVGDPKTMFTNSHSAMATVRLLDMESSSMRNMDDAFGVVPMPRLTTDQDGYYSTLHDGFTTVAIPTTVTGERLDMMGAVLEAMASASYNIVKPAYYETTLRTKLVSDPDSSEMMDIIIENLRTDAGYVYVYSFNAFHHGFRSLVSGKENTAISHYKSRQKADAKNATALNRRLERLITLANRNQ